MGNHKDSHFIDIYLEDYQSLFKWCIKKDNSLLSSIAFSLSESDTNALFSLLAFSDLVGYMFTKFMVK